MNPYKFSAIAHRDHDFCNPIAPGKVQHMLDLLALSADAFVLHLAGWTRRDRYVLIGDGYLRWGRDTPGFGLHLFHRPRPR